MCGLECFILIYFFFFVLEIFLKFSFWPIRPFARFRERGEFFNPGAQLGYLQLS